MGGHNAGDVASKLVASSIGNFFEATARPGTSFDIADDYKKYPPGGQRLAAGVIKANRDVHTISNTHAQHHGMGSTCVAIHLSDGMVHIAHVGDSRCYRIRDGQIQQMTRDHSLINDALDMKPDLTKEELARLPKNIITRALGMKDVVKVDVKSEPVLPGDQFLLCSDGLTGMVPVDDILKIVTFTPEPAEACELLIAEANNHGGTDNISALIVRVEEAVPDADVVIEAHAELEESVDEGEVMTVVEEELDEDDAVTLGPRAVPPAAAAQMAAQQAQRAAPIPAPAAPLEPAPPMAVEELMAHAPEEPTPVPVPGRKPSSPPAKAQPISAPPPPPPVPRFPDPPKARPSEPAPRPEPPPVRAALYAQPEIEASFTAGSHVIPVDEARARARKPTLDETPVEAPEVEIAPISEPLPDPALEEILSAEAALALLEGGEIDLDLRGPWQGKVAVRRCKSCKHEIYPGNAFCVECGTRVEDAASP
jgi:protein phosphatase